MAVTDDFDWETVTSLVEFDKTLRERFPAEAWMLDHPELGPLIVKAVNEEWTADTLLSQIKGSEWGRARTDAEEAWDILEGSSPEDAARQLEVRTEELADRIARLGATVSEDFAEDLARRALRSGLTDDEITGEILDASSAFTAGQFTAAETAVKAAANRYMIRLSDDDVEDRVRAILNNEDSVEGVNETLKARAMSKFPALADLVDRGTNLSDYFSDHRQTIATMMGEDVDAIDLAGDKRWAPVLGFAAEPSAAPRPMAAHEVERFVRGTNEFYATPNGRAELSANRLRLQSALGLR